MDDPSDEVVVETPPMPRKPDSPRGMWISAARLAAMPPGRMYQAMVAIAFLAIVGIVIRSEWNRSQVDHEHRQEVRDREMHYLLKISEGNRATEKVADRVDDLRRDQGQRLDRVIQLLERLVEKRDATED